MAPRKKRPADIRREATDPSGRLRFAPKSDEEWESIAALSEPPSVEDVEVPDDRPSFTANQLVAYNLQRARKSRGWSQEDLGSFLGFKTGRAWSKASVSAAETSWRPGRRVRNFDANEILAFACVFGLPVSYFFLPPERPEEPDELDSVFLVDDPGEVGVEVLRRSQLLELVEGLDAPAEYVDRVRMEHRRNFVDWEPSRHSTRIPLEVDQLQALVEQLREAGVDVNEALSAHRREIDEEA